jgi:hypothetical protein
MEANRLTFTLSAMTARQSSGSIPFAWNVVVDSAGKRSTDFVRWSTSIGSGFWRLGLNSSTVETREALATGVNVTEDTLSVELADGRTIAAPLAWYPRLAHGTAEERASWRLIGGGRGIHWAAIDEDISIANLLAGQPSMESQSSFKRWLKARAKPSHREK